MSQHAGRHPTFKMVEAFPQTTPQSKDALQHRHRSFYSRSERLRRFEPEALLPLFFLLVAPALLRHTDFFDSQLFYIFNGLLGVKSFVARAHFRHMSE